jgi:AraC family transcriptional regulator
VEKDLSEIADESIITTPESILGQGYEFYHGSNIDIMITRNPVKLCSFVHVHDGYEFFIPILYTPKQISLRIDSTTVQPTPGSIIPANPGQTHGTESIFTIYKSTAIFVQKQYMQQAAYSAASVRAVEFFAEANRCSSNLHNLINLFIQEASGQQAGYRLLLESISMQIVIELLRSTNNSAREKMNLKDVGARENILKAIDYLKENYNQKLSNAELLAIANLSPYYFIRLFKKETGKTPHEYLVHLKIEKAKELLMNSNYSVTEICFLCGFTEHSHFSKVFKKLTGTTPLNYRKNRSNLHI